MRLEESISSESHKFREKGKDCDAVNLYRQFIGKYLLSRTNLPLKLTFKTVVRRISSRSVMSIIFNSVQTRKKRRKKPIDK